MKPFSDPQKFYDTLLARAIFHSHFTSYIKKIIVSLDLSLTSTVLAFPFLLEQRVVEPARVLSD